MGRWDYDLYDSDGTLDYHYTITMRLEREMAYWLSPENIANDNFWLAQVLTVIELMLIFERRDTRLCSFESERIVRRWQDIILSVWDSDWSKEKGDYPYTLFSYRQSHRAAIVAMFDRLKDIARNYENSFEPNIEPTPLLSDYSLPYFSIRRWVASNNKEVVSTERIVQYLFVQILKDIEFWVSSDRRERVLEWDMPYSNEDVIAAVDSLALLSHAYERSPLVDVQTVQRWRKATIDMENQFIPDSDPTSNEKYLKLVNETFDKLEAVAQKYSPDDWW